MRKLLFSVAVLCGFTSFSQVTKSKHEQLSSPHEVEKCSQHHRMQEMKIKDPARYATVYRETIDPQPKGSGVAPKEKSRGVIYTIPVVFHILHNGGSENISDAQVADALSILNRDFRRLNTDANTVQTPFVGMPTDAEINFVFATVAPNGNCFSGITRTQNAITNNGDDGQAQVDAVIAGNNVYNAVWPHNRYLNIYVCKDLGGAAGYTFLPNSGGTPTENMFYNGIFILDDYCGSIGTGSAGASRALTHEVGHWMNLSHTWGDDNNPGDPSSCSQDDHVQDTPMCIGVTSCTLNSNTCNDTNDPNNFSSWTTNVVDNVENYMDYSYCSKMFTQGQVTRMRSALTSSTGGRNNIWTTANLSLVGGSSGTSLCALDFSANQTTLCAGTTVTYTPSQTTGIATYNWTFPGGTPSSSTAASPTVTYSSVGTHNASLSVTATSNGASYSKSKPSYITVNANTSVSLPISEGFVSATFPPTGWTIVNIGEVGTWTRSNSVGRAPTAGNSLRFDNFNIESGNDEIRLPKADIAAYSSASLTFDVAYAPYDATSFDGLQVLVSTDCGGTFTSVYSKSGTTLATANATTNAFVPTTTQWRSETVNLTPYVGNSSVWIAFRNISGYGNNLYVDNINVTGTAGTPPPVASFNSTGTSICAGQSITYTSTSTNSPTSYNWSFPGGTPSSSTSASQAVTYATAGTYTVSLTATNSGGSNTSSNQSVTVNNCLSITENELNSISVYPNPSSGSFTISAGEVVMNSVKVFNALGQVVYEVSGLQDSKQAVDMSNMAKGVYTVRVMTEVGTQHIPLVLEK